MNTFTIVALIALGLIVAFTTVAIFLATLSGLLYRISFWAAGIDTKDISQVLKHLGKK